MLMAMQARCWMGQRRLGKQTRLAERQHDASELHLSTIHCDMLSLARRAFGEVSSFGLSMASS